MPPAPNPTPGALGMVWRLLNGEQRRAGIVLVGMMLIGMLLEMLGVGLVIPALGLMTNQDIGASYPALVPLLGALGNPTKEQLVVGGVLTLVAVYAVKTLFIAYLASRQAQLAFGLQASVSQRLFAGYLRQPWTFHLQHNSAQLLRNVIGESGNFTGVVQAAMIGCAEGFVVLGLTILLVAFEPRAALMVVVVLGLSGWAFHQMTRARLLLWGEARQRHEGFRIQYVQEGFGGVKDVKLLGREAKFLEQYRQHNDANANVARHMYTLQQLPRLWLELLAVVGLAALVIVMLALGYPLEALLPTLGLFAAAAFRLMPSVVRIMNCFQSLRYGLPVIKMLYRELELAEGVLAPRRLHRIGFEDRIELDGITFNYPGADGPALSEVSLSIPRGASVGFIGGSGAGKSTLVDVLLGLLVPGKGRVLVDGIDIQTDLRAWQDQVGYVPQSIFLIDDSLRRNVAFGIVDSEIDEAAVRRAIEAAQLDAFVASLPNGLDTPVGERGVQLSGGQRQRIGIARAIYHDPRVLVLDEATSALDTETETSVMDAVRALRGDKTFLIVAHRLSTVAHCDRLYRLDHGRVVHEGASSEILGPV